MSNRDENRDWLTREAERRPDGYAAEWIRRYGLDGALDLIDAQGGDPWHYTWRDEEVIA